MKKFSVLVIARLLDRECNAGRRGLAFKLGQKAVRPMPYVIAGERQKHRLVPPAPLGQRHRKSLAEGCRNALRIIGIDQERRLAFLSRASEAR